MGRRNKVDMSSANLCSLVDMEIHPRIFRRKSYIVSTLLYTSFDRNWTDVARENLYEVVAGVPRWPEDFGI